MSTTVSPVELSDRDRTVLELERQRWKYQAAKDAAVLDVLGMMPARYSQVLQTVIDQPAAEVWDPVTVRRLRRLRDVRARDRGARRSGFSVEG